MIDREHDSIDYSKLAVWSGLLGGTVLFWYSIFTKGFFVSVLWLIVIAAMVGLYFKLTDKI